MTLSISKHCVHLFIILKTTLLSVVCIAAERLMYSFYVFLCRSSYNLEICITLNRSLLMLYSFLLSTNTHSLSTDCLWYHRFDHSRHYLFITVWSLLLGQVKIGLRVLTRPLPDQLPTIYRTLGENFNERVLPSIIHETLKAVVAQYNASQLITQREVWSLFFTTRYCYSPTRSQRVYPCSVGRQSRNTQDFDWACHKLQHRFGRCVDHDLELRQGIH